MTSSLSSSEVLSSLLLSSSNESDFSSFESSIYFGLSLTGLTAFFILMTNSLIGSTKSPSS